MSDNLKTNNLHSVFKNDADGFFKKLLPKGEQFQVFKDCKDQIKAVIEIQVEKVYEPPRLYRRVFYLSQAAMPDRIKLS